MDLFITSHAFLASSRGKVLRADTMGESSAATRYGATPPVEAARLGGIRISLPRAWQFASAQGFNTADFFGTCSDVLERLHDRVDPVACAHPRLKSVRSWRWVATELAVLVGNGHLGTATVGRVLEQPVWPRRRSQLKKHCSLGGRQARNLVGLQEPLNIFCVVALTQSNP